MPNNDYIKRSDALKAILGVSIYDTIEELEGARTIAENTWADGLYDAYKIIEEEVDAAYVEPVRHGRWIEYKHEGQMAQYCSECGSDPGVIYVYGRCPECGAYMNTQRVREDNDGTL